jgi:hypothetical protein
VSLVISGLPAYAFDKNFYSENDIMFYNPDASSCASKGTSPVGSCQALADARTAMWNAATIGDQNRFVNVTNKENGVSQAIVEAYMNQVIAKYGSGNDGSLKSWLDGQCVAFRPKDGECGKAVSKITSAQQTTIDMALSGSNAVGFAVGNSSAGVGVGKVTCVWKDKACRTDIEYESLASGVKCNAIKTTNGKTLNGGSDGECYGLEGAGDWAKKMKDQCQSPDTGGVGAATSTATSAGNGKDYASNNMFTKSEMTALAANQPFYEKAAQKAGIPWQMIAVIHYREHGFARSNPSNGQGVYQYPAGDGGPYPAGPISDEEFQRQTDFTANYILGKAGSKANALKNGDQGAIKYTFFGYNGRAKVYIDQAKALGFSDAEAANGEGSPYVMNRFDAKRDPTVEPTKSNKTWGQYKLDGTWPGTPGTSSYVYPANTQYGAYTYYAAIANVSTATCDGGQLGEGGLTLDQAKKLMMRYGKNVGNDSVKNMDAGPGTPGHDCNGGATSNCVSFSAFFMNKFSDTKYQGGNGNQVVNNLKSVAEGTGSEPKVFAVFSNGFSTEAGHTGIVLGIHGDKVVVGHASCSNSGSGEGNGTKEGGGAGWAVEYNKSQLGGLYLYSDTPQFAYLKNVDTSKIQEYINAT